MRTFGLLLGAGLGAAVTLLLDPERGRRRRAIARSRLTAASRAAARVAGGVARDVANRARGAAAETRARLQEDVPDDDVLVARVRARLGTLVSHPRAVTVVADRGRVTLEGPVFVDELEPALVQLRRVRGVRELESRLVAHAPGDGTPALQGGKRRLSPASAPPANAAVKFATAVAGGALAIYGARRRTLLGRGARSLGQTMLGAAISETALARWARTSMAKDAPTEVQARE